jgi:hypothetical protein
MSEDWNHLENKTDKKMQPLSHQGEFAVPLQRKEGYGRHLDYIRKLGWALLGAQPTLSKPNQTGA